MGTAGEPKSGRGWPVPVWAGDHLKKTVPRPPEQEATMRRGTQRLAPSVEGAVRLPIQHELTLAPLRTVFPLSVELSYSLA
jgi:hypothetical protein